MSNGDHSESGTSSVLLSLDGARRMVAERDELARQLAAAEKRVQALSMLLSDEAKHLVFGTAEQEPKGNIPVERPVSLTMAIIKALEKAERGLSEAELETSTSEFINLDAVLEVEPDAFQKSLQRAFRSSRIKKRSGRFYSPIVLGKMERGLIPQDHGLLYPSKTIISEVERVLSGAGEVMDAKTIITSVREDVEIASRLDQNPQAAYSALSRLIERQKAERVDGGYRWIGSHTRDTEEERMPNSGN